MSSDDLPRETRQKALEARKKMLDVRPKDSTPPLPETIVPGGVDCSAYYRVAAELYVRAAEAYSAGDVVTGHTFELWAHQYILFGQTCEAQQGSGDRGPIQPFTGAPQ